MQKWKNVNCCDKKTTFFETIIWWCFLFFPHTIFSPSPILSSFFLKKSLKKDSIKETCKDAMLPLLACHAPYGCLESKQTKKVNKNYSWLLAGHPAGGSLKNLYPAQPTLRCMSHDSFYYKNTVYTENLQCKSCEQRILWRIFFLYFLPLCNSWMYLLNVFLRGCGTLQISKKGSSVHCKYYYYFFFMWGACLGRRIIVKKNWKKKLWKKYSAAWCVIFILCMSCCCNS